MMRLILYITAHILFLSILHSPLQAQGVITVRVSFKVILNPADGARPTLGPSGAVLADADVDTTIAAMNDLYRPYFRGFRFQRVGPVIDVGGIGDMTGPSRYFNTNFVTDPNRIQLRNQMEEAAMTDGRYAWNNNAINVYVNGGTQGGICSFPGDHNIVIVGGRAIGPGQTLLHEIGHYFNLVHTHEDDLVDTLADNPSWDLDQIANNNFGVNYAMLSPAQKAQVDDVMLNLMSYHGTIGGSVVPTGSIYQSRLTEQQLDRWADGAAGIYGGNRQFVVDSLTIFVDVAAPQQRPFFGHSANPYNNLRDAVNQAISWRNGGWGSVLMLRPGAFNQQMTINTPLTLRATRRGSATIGRANQLAEPDPSTSKIEESSDEAQVISGSKPTKSGLPVNGVKQQR